MQNGESFDNESTSSLADTPVAISRSQYDGMIHIVKQYGMSLAMRQESRFGARD